VVARGDKPPNHGKPWTETEEQQLRELIPKNTPTPVIARMLGRTPTGVWQHAQVLGLRYNRRPRKPLID
jgi:hypothetical protein